MISTSEKEFVCIKYWSGKDSVLFLQVQSGHITPECLKKTHIQLYYTTVEFFTFYFIEEFNFQKVI